MPSHPTSKYPRIKAALKRRLLSGLYREGEALPSETDLAGEFGVSRMTARRAVDELEQEGYVTRVQGAGSYPTGRRFRQGVFRIRPLEEIAPGEPTFTRVLSSGLVVADAAERAALSLPDDAAVFGVTRLRGVGETPVMLERRAFLAANAAVLSGRNLGVESIHDLLVELTGVEIARVEQALDAVNAPAEVGRLLDLPVGRAVFLLRRVSYARGEAIGFSRYWVRPEVQPFIADFAP
ncbi:MAG TPA: GntR family transcriptional regulator [Deinococcales bacterium]|nr:GntR family transcriptional regulator [Deinococcales bacterium]